MSRLLLFKAQRADGEGWIEGMPVGNYIIDVDAVFEVDAEVQPYPVEILPETICQRREFQVDGVQAWEKDKLSNGEITYIITWYEGGFIAEAQSSVADPEMLAEINAFGRPTVPLNLVYPAGAPEKLIKLPVLLTKEVVRTALEQAGPSQEQP